MDNISSIFWNENRSNLNIVFIGACDGSHDNTIELLLKYSHWEALLIEPVLENFRDLAFFLCKHRVLHRTIPIQAAVSNDCRSGTVNITVIQGSGKNSSLPHWLQKQTASISEKVVRGIRQSSLHSSIKLKVIQEAVPCLLSSEIISEWMQRILFRTTESNINKSKNQCDDNAIADFFTSPRVPSNSSRHKGKVHDDNNRLRPHVMKVDTEGYDYFIVTHFLTSLSPNKLPLLILFESKLMSLDESKSLRELLISLGYHTTLGSIGKWKKESDSVAILGLAGVTRLLSDK